MNRPRARKVTRKPRSGIRRLNVNCGVGEQSHSAYLNIQKKLDERCRTIKLITDEQRSIGTKGFSLSAAVGKQSAVSAPSAAISDLANFIQDNQIFYSGAPSIDAPVRYVLESARQTITFANASSAPAVLRLYDIVAKRDTQLANESYISPNFDTYVLGSMLPESLWSAGMSAANGLTYSDFTLCNTYGCVPTDSALFNKYFTIKQVTTVQMPVGGVHRHQKNIRFNRFVDASVYGQSNLNAYGGLTEYCLMVVEGTPGTQAVSEATVQSMSSAAFINCTLEDEYQFTWASPYQSCLSIVDNLGTAANANAIKVINAVGAVTTVVPAV